MSHPRSNLQRRGNASLLRYLLLFGIAFGFHLFSMTAADWEVEAKGKPMHSSLFDFHAISLGGDDQPLDTYKGKVVLVVNTASKCGFTPQYAGLEELYNEYKDRGFVVLGFPSNQFMNQEPGTNEEIATFCKRNYGVTFPMFAKIDVNGPGADPIFNFLRESKPGVLGSESIKWNFTKFLINRDGEPVARFSPKTEPVKLKPEIEKLLGV
jgi:glutathione peroxidase